MRSKVLSTAVLVVLLEAGCASLHNDSAETASRPATVPPTSTPAPSNPQSQGNTSVRDAAGPQSADSPSKTQNDAKNAGVSPTPAPHGPRSAPAEEDRGGFTTRYAKFEPAEFSEIPDWQKDQMRDPWLAFLRGCKTLTAKQLWASTCNQAKQVPSSDEGAIRRFIEQQFSLYQVLDQRGEEGGIITGYYEPLLKGNRIADEKFRYPVYSVPGDLLYLDSNRMPKAYPKQKVYARVEGRKVVPLTAATAPGPGIYPIEAGAIGKDLRDRRVRVRLEHNRIVRYYSRNEIEQTRLPAARVLVWVDDPIMLYTMQVQGSGKVQLADGKLMRLAFADQNGYPFRSKIKRAGSAPKRGQLRGPSAVTTPAEVAENDDDDDSVDAEEDMEFGGATGVVRSLKLKREAPLTREQLAKRQTRDPSYVFFREIADSPDGPIGALGVPLTAGRSVAVDPRITPLGSPLFLSTTDPKTDGSLNRLVMAQDTGGAIRGALRADYFFGFGPGAGDLANRMKTEGRLWLMLPKSFRPSAAMLAGQTRSTTALPAECVVPDSEFCGDAGADSNASTAQQ